MSHILDIQNPDARRRTAAVAAVVLIDPATGQPVGPSNASITGPVTVDNDVTNPLYVAATPRDSVGRETITSLSAVTPVALTVPVGAVSAMIQADGGTVRLTQDGATNPTATIGMRVDDGVFYYVDTALADVKLIAQSGLTTNVQIEYFDRA